MRGEGGERESKEAVDVIVMQPLHNSEKNLRRMDQSVHRYPLGSTRVHCMHKLAVDPKAMPLLRR